MQRHLFIRLKPAASLLVLMALWISQPAKAQSPIQGPALLPGGNGAAGCMFDLQNTSGVDLHITSIHQAFFLPGATVDVEIWSRAGGIGTDPTNTTGTWMLEGSSTGIVVSGQGTVDDTMINLTGGINTSVSPGATVGLYVACTNMQSVSYSGGTAVGNTYASNADCALLEGYGGTYPFGSQFSPRSNNVEVHYVLGTPPIPHAQVNRPASGWDLNGITGTSTTVGRALTCPGAVTIGHFISNLPLGTPYDLAIQPGAALLPGLPFPANTLNLDLSLGLPVMLSTGTPTIPPGPNPLIWPGIPSLGLPFYAPPVPVLVNSQVYWVDPGNPDGVSLSAPCELQVVSISPGTTLSLGDDQLTTYSITSALCNGLSGATFYGTTYTDLHIDSNGSIRMGTAGASDFTPTEIEFHAEMPRVAAMWTDLSPNVAGTITVTPLPGSLLVDYSNVPSFGNASTSNSVQVTFDSAGQLTIANYAPDVSHIPATLVGISNGAAGTSSTSLSFDALTGAGPQTGPAMASVFQFSGLGPVPNISGFTSIQFPNGDGSSFLVQ